MTGRSAALLVLVAAAALIAWLVAAGPETGRPLAACPEAPRMAPASAPEVPGPPPSAPPLSTAVATVALPEVPSTGLAEDAASLGAALLEADRSIRSEIEVLDAERLLSRALLARPGLAAAVADLYPRLKNRGLAFAVARLLGRYLGDPRVREAMVAALGDADDIPRELAAYAFRGVRGEPRVACSLAAGFGSEAAPPALRAAHAFALAGMLDDLPEDVRRQTRACARSLVADPRADSALRAEAVDLLDVRGADRACVIALLRDEPDRAVALAAARALLRSGEDEAEIVCALERFAKTGAKGEPATHGFRALLEQERKAR